MKSQHVTFDDLRFAKVEPYRIRRQGFPEAIYCPGKTDSQVVSIFRSLAKGPGPVMATRVSAGVSRALVSEFPGARYYENARLVVWKPRPVRAQRRVAVITGGTADLPVAEEAAVTLEALGVRVNRVFDVGVAGLHRLFAHQGLLRGIGAAIVCAGMEGALPSVVGGIVACPVIAVPTSVGYGAHLQGLAPLLAMLNSCASNVSVVNIDNGFSAGVIASLIVSKAG